MMRYGSPMTDEKDYRRESIDSKGARDTSYQRFLEFKQRMKSDMKGGHPQELHGGGSMDGADISDDDEGGVNELDDMPLYDLQS